MADCSEWHRALGGAGLSPADLAAPGYLMHLRRLPSVALAPRPGTHRFADAMARALAAYADGSVLVDESKSPTYGLLLDRHPDVDLHVLHLVRDPVAVAHSWSRLTGVDTRPAAVAAAWSAWNLSIEALWARRGQRYLRVRYEDVVTAPRAVLTEVAAFAGLDPRDVATVVDDQRVLRMGTVHTVAGNHVRFRTGDVPLVLDQRWRTGMPDDARRTVTRLTTPLRRRYGYR